MGDAEWKQEVSGKLGTMSAGIDGLSNRMSRVESHTPHTCLHPELIGEVPVLKSEVAGLSKWKWWIMGTAVTLGIIAVGFAISSRTVSAETSVELREVHSDVNANAESIKVLSTGLYSTREEFLREVREVNRGIKGLEHRNDGQIVIDPGKMRKRLSKSEQRQLEKLLDQIEE